MIYEGEPYLDMSAKMVLDSFPPSTHELAPKERERESGQT